MALVLSADLSIELETASGATVHARLHGQANRLLLEVDDAGAFAGAGDATAVRGLAEGLSARGVVVRVVSEGRDLVSLGAVSAPWWQRRVTGSRRIRLGSMRGAFTRVRSRARRTAPVLPDATLIPPATLWPLTPTLRRPVRRPVTTTHDPARGGAPRLVLAKEDVWEGEHLSVYRLGERITIGSDAHRADTFAWALDDGYRVASAAGFDRLTFRRGDDSVVVPMATTPNAVGGRSL